MARADSNDDALARRMAKPPTRVALREAKAAWPLIPHEQAPLRPSRGVAPIQALGWPDAE